MAEGRGSDFIEDEQGTIWFKKRICVPEIDSLRETILREAHDSAYSIHPGSTKMYQDLKQNYWWYGLKKDHYRKRLNFRGPKTHENKPKPTKIAAENKFDENRHLFSSVPTKNTYFRRLSQGRRK
jgi:hypothetical protein